MAEEKAPTRFAPVVLGGLGSAALVAVTSARDWFHLGSGGTRYLVPDDQLGAEMPLALALALVLLAAWGVVLVTGRRARRVVLVVAALAAAGILACLVAAPFTLPDDIRAHLPSDPGDGAGPTAAYLVTCVVAPVALALVVLGLGLAPRWPEMSSRYDAPAAGSAPGAGGERPADDLADLELWKALDEGHDPT